MESPALPTLRPLRLGELLDRAVRLYRGNFLTFIGIIAVVYVPLMVLQTAANALLRSSTTQRMTTLDDMLTNYAYWGGMLATLLLVGVQLVLVQGIATGALTRAVADNYLGRKTGILDAYRGIGSSWLTLIGALLFLGIIIFIISVWWVVVPCIGWFTGLGMLVFVTGAVNPLVAPAVVLENQGAIEAVKRAWSLTRRRFWPVLGYICVLYLFSLIIVNGPAAIANVLLLQLFTAFGDQTMQLVLTAIIQGLVSLVLVLIYYPLQMTAFTLIYFDLRVRTEGFDLAVLTLESSGTTDLAEAIKTPAPPVNENLVTGTELGNFAILTFAGAGLYIFFIVFVMGITMLLTSLFN